MTQVDADEDLIGSYLAGYAARDSSAMAALYHADATLEVGTFRVEGRAAIEAFWAAWFTAFPDAASVVHDVAEDVDGFAWSWTETGTHLGPLDMAGAHVEPTGWRLEWSGRSRYDVGDGRIARAVLDVDLTPLQTLLSS